MAVILSFGTVGLGESSRHSINEVIGKEGEQQAKLQVEEQVVENEDAAGGDDYDDNFDDDE